MQAFYPLFLKALYGVIVLSGSLGALWVSDEFDGERLYFYAFFAIPLAFLLPYSFVLYPRYWQERLSFRRMCVLTVLVSHLWGVALLINMLSGGKVITYTHLTESRAEQHSLRVAYRRGGLGWLYRLRW